MMLGQWLFAIALLLVAGLSATGPAGAMPITVAAWRHSDVIPAQVTCDYRGCFGFGQKQWYRRPSYPPPYLPPNNNGGIYHRPAAVGVPSQPYARQVPLPPKPLLPPPVAPVRPVTTGLHKHTQWCRDHYQSYNARTDQYTTESGALRRCRSPFAP